MCYIYKHTEFFAEFPDEKGRMKKFITKTCPCNELESGTCKRQRYIQEKDFTSYTTNSDCLSYKCLNNFIIFNDE